MKVCNMLSAKNNKVANQFIISNVGIKIYSDKLGKFKEISGTMFQSYDSNIAFDTGSKIYLDKYYWDYSITTGKYRNIFLGENKKETEKKIKDGTYILTNLN